MGDKSWKQFERACADLIDGRRYTANQGGRVDVEGPLVIGQCKEVKNLSLSALTKLAEEMCEIGLKRRKLGLVFAKARRGSGKKSSPLVVMTNETWNRLWVSFNVMREQLKETPHDLHRERTALPGPAIGGQGLDDSGRTEARALSAA